MDPPFLLAGATGRDPAIAVWFAVADPLRAMVEPWFARMRDFGPDVGELLHDHRPTVCVGAVAFGYVDAFAAHAAIGFFHGASLPDPAGLLEGLGKRMRHVKLRPGRAVDETALAALIRAAYRDAADRLRSA